MKNLAWLVAAAATLALPAAPALPAPAADAAMATAAHAVGAPSHSSVTPITVASNHAGRQIRVGDSPDAMAITPNGKTAYVVNAPFPSPFNPSPIGSVTPIQTATNHALKRIIVGLDPSSVAITPDGRTVYVSNLLAAP